MSVECSALDCLRKRALTACQAQGLLSEFDLDTIALTVWSTVHGIATLLPDGLVKLDGSGSVSEEQLLGVAGQILRVMRRDAQWPQTGVPKG